MNAKVTRMQDWRPSLMSAPAPSPGPGSSTPGWVNPGWAWNGSAWVWYGDPGVPPPCPPPQPCPPAGWPCPPVPNPNCGPPSCWSELMKAQSCWTSSQELYCFISQVISDIFANNPAIIPPPPPSAGTGPIIGVTDGSDAAPGQVGEFVSFPISGNVTAAPQTQVISVGVIQPGDWDIRAAIYFEDFIEGVLAFLSPVPTGVSNNMTACMQTLATSGPTDEVGAALTFPTARGSFSVPTLIPIKMLTNYWGTSTTGSAFVGQLEARRVR